MPKNKHRWAKIRRAAVPKRFHYVGLADGRSVVYRGQNPFDWGPIDVDREALRRLLGTLNGLRGTAIERIGRPLCETFKKEYDEGKHRRVIDAPDLNAEVGVVDPVAAGMRPRPTIVDRFPELAENPAALLKRDPALYRLLYGESTPDELSRERCFLCFDDGQDSCICHTGAGVCDRTCNEPGAAVVASDLAGPAEPGTTAKET